MFREYDSLLYGVKVRMDGGVLSRQITAISRCFHRAVAVEGTELLRFAIL
jgi:hypothetical protein